MNIIVSEKEMILIATGNNYQIRQHIIGQNRERQLIMQKEVPFLSQKAKKNTLSNKRIVFKSL